MKGKKEARYVFEVIPHARQRYETPGDWIPGRPARLIASKLKSRRFEFLVLFHELIEYELCRKHGITDREIVAFDKRFERERERGLHSPLADPGDAADAPYRREHKFATKLERRMAKELGVNWKKYSKAVYTIAKKRHLAYRL